MQLLFFRKLFFFGLVQKVCHVVPRAGGVSAQVIVLPWTALLSPQLARANHAVGNFYGIRAFDQTLYGFEHGDVALSMQCIDTVVVHQIDGQESASDVIEQRFVLRYVVSRYTKEFPRATGQDFKVTVPRQSAIRIEFSMNRQELL